MNLRHVSAIGATLVLGASAAVAGLAPLHAQWRSERDETFRQLELFGDVLRLVQSEYVEDADEEELIQAAMQGMLQSLDPHSSFYDERAYRNVQVETRGEYGGLGIEVTLEDGLVKVIAPMDDTPADRAGVESGDYISRINGEAVLGLTLGEAVDKMRGDIGESIDLEILREGVDPFDVTITRELITVTPVEWNLEDNGVVYLRVATFSEQADEETRVALRQAKRELGRDFSGVVLDLRDNPGGLLGEAIGVADVFLDGGEVVSTRGRRSQDIERYNARGGDLANGKPIVVIINQGSASAAEIVAGAIQDRRRGTVVGRTSFGKGSVQTLIPIQGGRSGAVRLTTARYYTPSGRSIQAEGIAPDVPVAASIEEQDRDALSERSYANALGNGDFSLTDDDAEQPVDSGVDPADVEYPPEDFPEDGDFQLQRALELLIAGSGQSGRLAQAG